MEQAPLFHCHDCKNQKTLDNFKLREKKDRYGEKGQPTSWCIPCAAKEQHRRQTKKRKHDEEGPAGPNLAISLEQFTELLRQQALTGDINCSTCVSTQGLSNEVENVIIKHVWEVTGFRFTYGWFLLNVQWLKFPATSIRYKTKHVQKNGVVQRVYRCCQSTASSNNHDKMPTEDGKQCRDTHRMSCFHCNGLLYMTLQNGYLDCALQHILKHIPYKDISIPENWRKFIRDNYHSGPAKVRAPCHLISSN